MSKGLERSQKSLISDWLQSLSKGDEEAFTRRLSWDGFTLENLAWALDPPEASIPENPSWINLLEEISEIGMKANKSQESITGVSIISGSPMLRLPFWHAWLPVATWAINSIKNDFCQIEYLPILTDSAWHDLEVSILSRLCSVTEQALWNLFNSTRSPGHFVTAEVRIRSGADTSEAKIFYDKFIDNILSSGYQVILQEYPVLGRIISQTLYNWTNATKELLFRISDSRKELEEAFQVSSKAVLSKVDCDRGDNHQGGRSVSILYFQDNETSTIRVVYKPKQLDLDANFNAFVELLNNSSSLPPLRSVRVINKGDYGFMEWIDHIQCTNKDEVFRFYENSGRLLAILHLLGCTDCHHENLIANGDQLMLIDCETLFHPDLKVFIADNIDDDSPLNQLMHRSVLRTGLLPQWSITGKESKIAFDISALGINIPTEQMEMPGWLNINTDAMIPGKVLERINIPTSLPMARESSLYLLDFAESVAHGFQKQSEIVIINKTLISSALDSFIGTSRRLIIRATRVYHSVQRQLLEPSALRSSFGQFIRLEQLARCFLPATICPHNWPIFHDEVAQMEDLDIPFFDHLLDTFDVRLQRNCLVHLNLIERHGLDSCLRRLESFNSDEVSFQIQLIYGSIKAKYFTSNNTNSDQISSSSCGAGKVTAVSRYMPEALRLADQIWSKSITTPNGAPEWLSLDLTAVSDCYNFGIIGDSLYSGTSGIGLLFARLSNYYADTDQVQSQLWIDRAHKCFMHLQRFFQGNEKAGFVDLLRNTSLGLSGSAGHLIVLLIMTDLGCDLASNARFNILESIQGHLRTSTIHAVDILSGLAGLIGPLVLADSDLSQDLATNCGDIILQQQEASGGWRSPTKISTRTRGPLTGFSHGTSGIAAALLKLYQVTRYDRFADAAYRALAYERSTFDLEAANWPDLRVGEALNRFGRSWCHGAPGILLSRLIIRSLGLGDSLIDHEINMAKTASIDVIKRMSDSDGSITSNICCGFFGISSILRLESRLSMTALSPLIQAAEANLISLAREQNGYPFGDSLFRIIDMPGLLTGNAGIALALLEAAEGSDLLPFVLSSALFEPQI